MALFDDSEKTEPATPRKRADARRSGNVPKSSDLNIALLLLAIFVSLWLFGFPSLLKISDVTRRMIDEMSTVQIDHASLVSLLAHVLVAVLGVVYPFALVALLVALVSNLSQVGFLLTPAPLKWDLDKVNPIKGLSKLFSLRALTRTTFGLFKITVVGLVLVWTLYEEVTRNDTISLFGLMTVSWGEAVTHTIGVVVKMGLRAVAALIILATLDFMYQRWQYEKDLKMTKQEVREEMLRLEGDPKVKERRRKVQHEVAFQRMASDVPESDVVITHPTRYSVAIQYRRGSMSAPRCVAKGGGWMAQRIREIAMEHGVPIVEKPPLVRALFAVVEVGQEVPQESYRAVAEVLAYAYKLARRPSGAKEPVA